MIDLMEQNGLQWLILAVVTLVGVLIRQMTGRIEHMDRKLGRLTEDMVRVKTKLNLHPAEFYSREDD